MITTAVEANLLTERLDHTLTGADRQRGSQPELQKMTELKPEPLPLQYHAPKKASESRVIQFIVELFGLVLFMAFLGAAVLAWLWLK